MRYLIIFVLVLIGVQGNGQTANARLGEPLSGLIIESAYYLPLPEGEIELSQVLDGTNDQLFRKLSSFEEDLHPDVHEYWIKLDLKNITSESKAWVFDFENWTKVIAYVPENGSYTQLKSGHLLPYKERDFARANKSLIELKIGAEETKTVYFNLGSTINYLQVPTNLRFKVFTRDKFERGEINHRIALGFFSGAYIIMLFYNLFIYFSTRDRNYIPYMVALLGALLLTFHNSGYTVSILSAWENYVDMHSKMQFFLSQLLGSSMLIFTAWFLDVKNRYPKYYTVLKILLIIIVFLPVPSLLGHANLNEKLSGLDGIVTMSFILILAIKSALVRHPSSQFFLVGYGAFALGIIVILSTFIGVLPADVRDYYPLNIGSSIEMVFFSLALGNRINVLAKDNELKQAEIIHQLHEKQELQLNINKELEIKVTQRTKEIEHQKILIEQEREKSENLLLNILPAPVANELKEKGSATPQSYENVSVLFADLVGFTVRAGVMTPASIINELDYCFQAFDDIIEKYGLEKIKTMGDGYMCAGGVPLPSPDSSINTVKAGIEMQRFIKEWGKRKENLGKKPWQIRVGIHTGEIIAGVVGKKKFAYDIWGDTVNTASRLETACEPGKVNISGTTHAILKNQIISEFRGKILVKEKEVEMYYVLETV